MNISDFDSWLVFFGFCLTAAVSSHRFISRVTDALLKEAIKISKSAKADTEALKYKVAEVEQGVLVANMGPISDTAMSVLQGMYSLHKRRLNLK